ncbi:transcription termination/antitermination protein NusA [Candidatus Peregrinibacteria bacterium CG_4_9_14_0_2_um_filter_53_11]|nr:MAG: transcription termination/antitermination protein NusA [Candidatus Peregrinibacteria bacterium CG_4_9_14_0_2_um_filter_53_11]
MQSTFFAAINQLCDEKNLPRDVVMETVKAALRAAYRKDYGNRDQNVDVDLDEKSGNITVYLIKDVVEKVEEPEAQITVKEAGKYLKTPKVGDEVRIDVTPIGYGRIAAQSAKQVIIQRLQEAERELMYHTFKDRENELLNALVHRVEYNQVYIDLDKITTILPPDQQIPGERYFAGQRIKIYLDKVIRTTKGPQLLISRTHRNLVRKLLELEIPEIKSGLVEVKAIARLPGLRCKIAVSSNDAKVDPIGACVGQKGVRVQNVTEELNGERIDVIQWHDNPLQFIRASLSPAKITHIRVDEKIRRASVYVAEDQRPLAIGKQGQNVRLASQLTGYEIDILDAKDIPEGAVEESPEQTSSTPTSVAPPKAKERVELISSLEGVPSNIIERLAEANLTNVEQLKGLSAKDFTMIDGVTDEEALMLAEALKKVK